MKRLLGPILAVAALFCAPLAWSQNGYPAYSTSSDPQQQAGSSDSSQGDYPTYSSSNGMPQQAGSTDSSQSGSATYSGSSDAPQQAGSTDSSQNGVDDTPQSGSQDNSQSGLGGPQDTFTHPEKLPPLNLFGDVISHTGYGFTLSATSLAQYASGYSGQPGYWDGLSLLNAGVNFVQARSHLLWTLGYNGGVSTIYGYISGYSILSQAARTRIIWQIAKRWQFRIKDEYFYSDDPFHPFFAYLGAPEPNYPNPVIYYPQTVVEQNQGTADLTYVLGAHDLIDFNGGESFQHFLRGVQSQSNYNLGSLWNSITYSGGGFYQHLFNSRLSGGVGYVFSALDFGHGESRAGVQMIQTFASYKLSSRMTVSGWVGPELTGTKDLVPVFCFASGCLIEIEHNSFLDVAEGGTFSWAGSHSNSFGAQFSHSITNGGGLFGAVHYYAASATWARPINRRWSVSAGFLYDNSSSVTTFQGNQFLHGSQGTVGFTRKINDAWNMAGYYAFIHQVQNYYGINGLPNSLNTSGLGLTVQYAWNHSLGR